MEKLGKINTIVDAFTEKLPIGETWYEERVALCKACPKFSKNAESLTPADALKQFTLGGFCTICGCVATRKASQKQEECALSDLGETPKWKSLAVKTADKDDWDVYNNSPHIIELGLEPDAYIVEYLKPFKTKEESMIELLFEGKHIITKTDVSCGCTVISYEKIGENLYRINIHMKPEYLKTGKSVKAAFVYFNDRQVKIKIKLEKK
jgi:hypothetical protein